MSFDGAVHESVQFVVVDQLVSGDTLCSHDFGVDSREN